MGEILRKLSSQASYEVEIRHSRFIVTATKVETLAQTLEFFETVADPAANHNCWAYRFGQSYRFSDDGEPASTAGKPILTAIDGQNFDLTMVVVTRYFGGTKLGVGGLVRAYGGSAARCLQNAQSEEIIATRQGIMRAPFTYTGAVHKLLADSQAARLSENFDSDGLVITFEISEINWQAMATKLQNITRGQATIRSLLS